MFLPTNLEEMQARGWSELDVLLISGDAYLDHPSFGVPLLGRVLESAGYRVGILAQPQWKDLSEISSMGRPKLFCGVSAGTMDSLLNIYTSNRRLRDYDSYSPGGRAGLRPERATLVYCNLVRQCFKGLPLVIGGIEASLRRFTHYDFWENRLRRSILLDSRADVLFYGMAEKSLVEFANHLRQGGTLQNLPRIRGTARVHRDFSHLPANEILELSSHSELCKNKESFLNNAITIERESNPHNAKVLIEECEGRFIVVEKPPLPLSTAELDKIYDLPFERKPHYKYNEKIPAYETIKFSISATRGCFGGCTFCAITLQQGRDIQSRSPQSVHREVESLKKLPSFTGTITDVGGPSANMYGIKGKDLEICKSCKKMSCLFPKICFNLNTDHTSQIELLRQVRAQQGVKHVYVNSGIRYDLALESPAYIQEIATHHTQGILSVAPEHTDEDVLELMKKPPIEKYNEFVQQFECATKAAQKKQYLSPYFISSFPGADKEVNLKMKDYFVKHKMRPEQIQDFIPTPMTLATAIYYSELHPRTKAPLYVEKAISSRKEQKRTLMAHHGPPSRKSGKPGGKGRRG